MKRELLNVARTHALVNELVAEGVKMDRGAEKIVGYVAGEPVFTAKKGSFGFVCLIDERILIDKRSASVVICA